MAIYKRWKIADATATYEFNPNPNAMTSPFGKRNVTSKPTAAVDGQILFFEGGKHAQEWTFSGDILTSTQYEALRHWVYERLGRRVIVSDHFGRDIQCVLTQFNPTPKRAVGKYWRHTYEITALVVSVSAATVSEVPV